MKEVINQENLQCVSQVRKSNILIRSRHNLTTIEHRIFSNAMAKIGKNETELKKYFIPCSDILGFQCLNNFYFCKLSLKKIVERLKDTTISIYDNKTWSDIRIFYCINGFRDEIPKIELCFHSDMKKFLLNLTDEMIIYNLENVLNFKSKYSFRIYELCKQFQNIGEHKISVKFLKYLFCVEDKYSQFSDFQVNILQRPIEEINYYTDINVSFNLCKSDSNEHYVHFLIQEKQKSSNQFLYSNLISMQLQNRFVAEDTSVKEKYMKNTPKKYPPIFHEKSYQKTIPTENKITKNILFSKKLDLKYLKEQLAIDKNDLDYYQKHQRLRQSDIFRFKDKSIDYANKIQKSREFFLYQIRNADLFAVRICGQWRVLFLDINIKLLRTNGMNELDSFLKSLPKLLYFDLVCQLFKIKKRVLFELLYQGFLNRFCYNGNLSILTSDIIRHIEQQNNFSEQFIEDQLINS